MIDTYLSELKLQILRLTALLLCLSAGVACRHPAVADHSAPLQSMRIIVKFEQSLDVSPAAAPLLDSLGRDLQCTLKLLQTLADNAYVYRCETAETVDELQARLGRLGRRDDVEYGEIDAMRRIY